MKPIIAIVGTPNAGKSTLFNRMTRTQNALVDDRPGITRDRHYGQVSWENCVFSLIDTGGFIETDDDVFSPHIHHQVMQAISDATVILHLLDGKNGLTPFDHDIAAILRGTEKPALHVVNKVDGPEQENRVHDFYDLGIDHFFSISAEHGYGMIDFMDHLITVLPATDAPAEIRNDQPIKVAVVGRPNAGKSSLINRILGADRMVVSSQPGTTRDAVDSAFQFKGKNYLFIDTAGIRRKGKVNQKIEKYSIIKALKSLSRCDIALIMIDAAEGVTDQDISVAGYAHERGCGSIFLLNKWDLVEKDANTSKKFMEDLRYQAKFLSFAPALTISALTGQRVPRIFNLIDQVFAQYSRRISTGQLNRALSQALIDTPPSLHKGKRLKFYYATQIDVCPPTIVCFVNYPNAVHFSYQRYLTNCIRKAHRLDQTPLRLIFKQRSGFIDFSGRKKPDRKHKTRRKSRPGRK